MANYILSTHPNRHLIGKPGSLWNLETPALVLDLDVLEANITRAAARARVRGIALRPHAKTHKSARIAQMQIDAGANGVCVQTVGEAEALFEAGIRNIHVASVFASSLKMRRLAMLASSGCDIKCVVDHEQVIAELAHAADALGVRIGTLVQIDTGTGREGVVHPQKAVELAEKIAKNKSLIFCGIQAYAGWMQHIIGSSERKTAATKVHSQILGIREALIAASLTPQIITGAGTGSFAIDSEANVFTELQPGSYVFMDADYGSLQYTTDDPPYATSLHVMVSVISNHSVSSVTIDGGIKSFAMDKGAPIIVRGAPEGSTCLAIADEHGRVDIPAGAVKPAINARILCATPHCDPTVNLYDWYHCHRKDTLVDLWPVNARGCSL